MEVSTENVGPAAVVRITGSIDSMTAEMLLTTLRAELEAGNIRLVGDFGGVAYTSSAGLRALLATVKEARQKGGDFRLAAVQPAVHKVLELSGFTSILKLYSDVDAAIASYAS